MTKHTRINAALTVLVISLGFGSLFIGATDTGTPFSLLRGTLDPSAAVILWEIRAPRVAAALFAGALVALAGAIAQGVFANPIAEPTLIGITASAAFGAVMVIAISTGGIGNPLVLAAAFGTALTSSVVMLRIARANSIGVPALVVVGVAVAAIANGLVATISAFVEDAEVRSVGFWTSGTLAFSNWLDVAMLGAALLFLVLAIPRLGRFLDILSFGDVQVRLLGSEPQRIRLGLLALVSAAVAVSTVTMGSLAFLGLAAPHIARMLLGHSYRDVLPTSALLGAALLLTADAVARTVIAPAELPISVVTALVGAPLLIALMIRKKEWRDAPTS